MPHLTVTLAALALFILSACNQTPKQSPPTQSAPATQPASATAPDPLARFTPLIHTSDLGSLPYRLLKPTHLDSAKKYPLVIMLHGSFERGSDNLKQMTKFTKAFADDAVQSPHPCFMIAPQCPEGSAWADTRSTPEFRETARATSTYRLAEKPSDMTLLLLDTIDSVIKNNPNIDPHRIYVSGFSLGGYAVYELLMRRPNFFAAATVVSGGGDETQAARIAHVPLWIFQGALDPAVKPTAARNMVAALKAAGGNPRYTEYPDKNHSIGQPTLNPETLDWLFSQKLPN